MTIADFDNAHVAHSYFMNEHNKYHKEQMQVLEKYQELENYYNGLREELKDHFAKRPPSKPF